MAKNMGRTSVFFAGQAGFIIESSSGERLAIDLYLSNCVERLEGHMGFKRLQSAPICAEDVKADYIIATHPHWDHFDVDSMPVLMSDEKAKLLASVNCRELVKMLNLDERRVMYVQTGDRVCCGAFDVRCVFCDHGIGAPDAFGLVIRVDEKTVYVAGDTSLRTDKVSELLATGPFDVMIAPINGAFGNLNEQACAKLSSLLKPRLTIPCHYGICAAHGGEPGKFIHFMQQEAPEQRYLLMATGECLIIE